MTLILDFYFAGSFLVVASKVILIVFLGEDFGEVLFLGNEVVGLFDEMNGKGVELEVVGAGIEVEGVCVIVVVGIVVVETVVDVVVVGGPVVGVVIVVLEEVLEG
mmetsp:Transcript_13648/g.18747  ORF Transcript_13648/g.18747 Transcript_13648/m.18747 type:complete len:105 (+) Transcript_13648:132-446(+)|eukprot:CAMPEP_0201495974 /NCGR_PEP_ID=MMETSP0151_2-20130828/57099_1 /ASSEMBLY_ACC=CAM_ASM_000257 /TAXON_ID=200890 /ORGANISM="Paramoeba atlantica, Strain 621/1 / CCAP 1560/9" /LENGTH=104 /DNA_ID=CAMNT_0047885423 /DNA_START=52 /DNA_END=366 /DNA_ORIENTATION=-